MPSTMPKLILSIAEREAIKSVGEMLFNLTIAVDKLVSIDMAEAEELRETILSI